MRYAIRMESSLIIPTLTDLAVTALRSSIIFLYTFLILRLIAKKQVSQFTWFDILLIVALGSAVGDTMVYPEKTIPIFVAMTAIFVVILLVRLFSHLIVHNEYAEDVLEGQEILLVDNGKILRDALEEAGLSEREFRTLLREKGMLNLRWIDKVFLETNGEISVIKRNKPSRGNHA